MALVVAGPLIVVATLLHPSRETAGTIIASEVRLIAASDTIVVELVTSADMPPVVLIH